MLKRLYVDNIRCFTNFELSPDRVAVLVGPNGGGKSSAYRVLAALQAFLTVGQEAQQVFAGSQTRWDRRSTQHIELEVVGPADVAYAYSLKLAPQADGRRIVVEEEQLLADKQPVYRFSGGEVQLFGDQPSSSPRTAFPFIPTRSFIPLLEPRHDNQLIMGFRQWLTGMWLFSLRPQDIIEASNAEQNILVRDGSNFVSWYRFLAQEQPAVREALLADLEPVIHGLREIRLVGAGPTTKVMQLDCETAGKRFQLSLGELSDGQRALLVLYAIKHAIAGQASLLMFDEPDNYIAAREIQPWLSGLREVVADSPHTTLLVISHHPEVIDYLAPDQVLRLWREDGPSRVEEVSFDGASGVSASERLRLEAE